jgi:hypothetical protein
MRHLVILHILLIFFVQSFCLAQGRIDSLLQRLIVCTVDSGDYKWSKEGHKINYGEVEYRVEPSYCGKIIFQKDTIINESYRIFDQILKYGSINDLRGMTESKIPSIRVYGYWGLVERKEDILSKKVLEQHKNDKARIWTCGGDVYVETSVIDYMQEITSWHKNNK